MGRAGKKSVLELTIYVGLSGVWPFASEEQQNVQKDRACGGELPAKSCLVSLPPSATHIHIRGLPASVGPKPCILMETILSGPQRPFKNKPLPIFTNLQALASMKSNQLEKEVNDCAPKELHQTICRGHDVILATVLLLGQLS